MPKPTKSPDVKKIETCSHKGKDFIRANGEWEEQKKVVKPTKSPLGRVFVPVKTEQEWKSLMEACEAYNKRTGYNFCWCDGDKPTQAKYSEESVIYFGDYETEYKENKMMFDSIYKADPDKCSKKLSYQEAMKRLGATETKKDRWKPISIKKGVGDLHRIFLWILMIALGLLVIVGIFYAIVSL